MEMEELTKGLKKLIDVAEFSSLARHDRDRMATEIRLFRGRISDLESAVEARGIRITELESMLDAKSRQVAQLAEENVRLAGRQINADQAAEITDLRRTLMVMQKAYEQDGKEIVRLQNCNNNLCGELNDQRAKQPPCPQCAAIARLNVAYAHWILLHDSGGYVLWDGSKTKESKPTLIAAVDQELGPEKAVKP